MLDFQDNKICFVNICVPRSYCKLCKISIFLGSFFAKMRVFERFLFVV